jgi:hypothetical protein
LDTIFEGDEDYFNLMPNYAKQLYEKEDYASEGCCDFDPNILGKIIGKLKGELD